MKQQLLAFLNNLILFDYILFAGVTLIFILLLVLAVVVRTKLGLAVILIFLAFAELILGYTVGYSMMHSYLFKTELQRVDSKRLEFTDALVVAGAFSNASSRSFERCEVTAEVYKVSGNSLLDALYPLNPFAKTSIITDKALSPGNQEEFKIIVEPFTYAKDYNISIGVDCR